MPHDLIMIRISEACCSFSTYFRYDIRSDARQILKWIEAGDRDICDPETLCLSNLSRDMLNHELPSLSPVSIQELKFFKIVQLFFVQVFLARENQRGNLIHKNRTYPGFQHFHQQHCCHHQEFQWNTWLWPHFLKM